MNRKKMIKATLVACVFFLGLGGWLLHGRVHPFSMGTVYWIPFIAGIFSVFFVPVFFWFKRTLTIAYLINGFSAILGTIAMGHYSIVHFNGPITPRSLVLNTLFADIMLLWAKFAAGKALYNLEFLKSDTDTVPGGRFLRYPNMGWWCVHLIVITIVYALGNILWK